MGNYKQEPQAQQSIQTLRTQLQEDLLTFIRADNHTIGYMVAWISKEMDLEQLEDLVDELDAVYTIGGRSVLGRRRPKK